MLQRPPAVRGERGEWGARECLGLHLSQQGMQLHYDRVVTHTHEGQHLSTTEVVTLTPEGQYLSTTGVKSPTSEGTT